MDEMKLGYLPLRQHRDPKLAHQQWRRLRVVQAQQHKHRGAEPRVQRQPRHQRGLAGPVPRRNRFR